jgi:hypothetical protein
VRELDGLPLALATAGAYLSQLSTSFADYLQLYKASWLQLQQATPNVFPYDDRALYSTWNISLNHVKQQSSHAAKLLQLWAYSYNQDVCLQLLQQCQNDVPGWFLELTKDKINCEKAVRVLCDHALVETDATFGVGSKESQGHGMHSCVHSWTMHIVNKGRYDEMARLASRCVGLHVPSRNTSHHWVTQQRLLRHANRCQEVIVPGLARTSQDDSPSTLAAKHGIGNLF